MGVVHLHKEWSVRPEAFLYQTIVRDLAYFSPDQCSELTLEQLYPVGSQCFLTYRNYYGCQAEVSEEVNYCGLVWLLGRSEGIEESVVELVMEHCTAEGVGGRVWVMGGVSNVYGKRTALG